MNVVADSPEVRMLRNIDNNVKISGSAAEASGMSFAGNANTGTGRNPWLNFNNQYFLSGNPSFAVEVASRCD